jgi:hypothetical protein
MTNRCLKGKKKASQSQETTQSTFSKVKLIIPAHPPSVNSGSSMGQFGNSYYYILRDPRYGHYKQGDPRYDSKPEFTDVLLLKPTVLPWGHM